MLPSSTIKSSALLLLLCLQCFAFTSSAQVKYHANNNVQLVVSGTSTMHDWTMKSTKGDCNATFTLSPSGALTGLIFLSFALPAETLKSEHSSMDKNAYKSLKTTQFKTITYDLTSATVSADGTIKCQGKLTIAGSTQTAELVATYKVNADKSITVSGSKKISMKDYSVVPPTFMMGTVKTGNDITLKFDLQLLPK